jgi:hypothetical protein
LENIGAAGMATWSQTVYASFGGKEEAMTARRATQNLRRKKENWWRNEITNFRYHMPVSEQPSCSSVAFFMHMVHHIIISPRVFVLPPPSSLFSSLPASAEALASLPMLYFSGNDFFIPSYQGLNEIVDNQQLVLFRFPSLHSLLCCFAKKPVSQNIRGEASRGPQNEDRQFLRRPRTMPGRETKSQTEENAKHQKMRQLLGKEESGDN